MSERHIFKPIEFGGETCERCGHNFRSSIHLRVNEITRTPSGSPLPESDSADHLGVVIGRKDTTR